MKRTHTHFGAIVLLIIGLLITSLTPIIGRYFPLPDSLKGFLTGIGLMIEFLGLLKIQRNKKNHSCTKSMI